MTLAIIPFSGFYNSIHDAELDRACEMILSDDRGHCVHDALPMRLSDSVDWRKAHTDYARRYAIEWAERFGVRGLEFESLHSPREYNFTTDRIFVEIPAGELARIYRAVRRKSLPEVAREMFTSRDGFISFYSPIVANWGPMRQLDHNQWFAVLTAWQRQNEPEFDEWDLVEDWSGNGMVDNWVLNTPAAIRVADLAYRIRRMRGEV